MGQRTSGDDDRLGLTRRTVVTAAAAVLIAGQARAAKRFDGPTIVFCSYGGSYQDNEKVCY